MDVFSQRIDSSAKQSALLQLFQVNRPGTHLIIVCNLVHPGTHRITTTRLSNAERIAVEQQIAELEKAKVPAKLPGVFGVFDRPVPSASSADPPPQPAISREFLRINPSYYRCPENWEKLVQTLAMNPLGWAEDEEDADEAQDELITRGLWTLGNLNAAFKSSFARRHDGGAP